MRLSTKSILIIIIVFLLGTNIASFITLSNHIKEVHQSQNQEIKIPSSQVGQFFKSELSLSEDQAVLFRKYRRTYNQSANHVLHSMETIREKMAAELKSSNPDREKLNAFAVQLGDKHKVLKEYTFDYYFNLQSALEADQQEKMIDIFQAMLTEQGYVKTPSGNRQGKGNRGGKGFRRNNEVISDSIKND